MHKKSKRAKLGLTQNPNLFVRKCFQFGHLVYLNSLIKNILCLDLEVLRKSYKYFILLGLFVTSQSFALAEDNQKTMKMRANSADLDQSKHLGIYEGNVKLDQGTTHIRADKAETKGNLENKLIKAIAIGNLKKPAHYWTLTATDKPAFHAYAQKISYYPEKHLIKLIGHARIQQGDNSFCAPEIIYDTLAQHVVTKRLSSEAQTEIIFYPEKKHG